MCPHWLYLLYLTLYMKQAIFAIANTKIFKFYGNYTNKLPIWYTVIDIIHAIPNCHITERSVSFAELSSVRSVETAAIHGTYNSTNTKKAKPESGVKTPESVDSSAAASPAPYRILIVDTTASFAAKPESKLTAGCHCPNPQGAKTGAIRRPIVPRILSEQSPVICKVKSTLRKSQMITLANSKTVPALSAKSFAFSHMRRSVDFKVGIRYGGNSSTNGGSSPFSTVLEKIHSEITPSKIPSK